MPPLGEEQELWQTAHTSQLKGPCLEVSQEMSLGVGTGRVLGPVHPEGREPEVSESTLSSTRLCPVGHRRRCAGARGVLGMWTHKEKVTGDHGRAGGLNGSCG